MKHRKDNMAGGAYLLLMISQLAALRVIVGGRSPGHLDMTERWQWPHPANREYSRTHQWSVPGSSEFWRIFTRIEIGLQP